MLLLYNSIISYVYLFWYLHKQVSYIKFIDQIGICLVSVKNIRALYNYVRRTSYLSKVKTYGCFIFILLDYKYFIIQVFVLKSQ